VSNYKSSHRRTKY